MKIYRGSLLRLLLLAGLTVLLMSACRPQEEPPAAVLIRIDERAVSFHDFEAEFNRHLKARGLLSKETRQDLRRSFLAQKINRELILSAADRAGIDLSETRQKEIVVENLKDYAEDDFEAMLEEQGLTLEDWHRQLLENSRIEETLSRLAYADMVVDKEEVADYYRQHHKEFDRPEQVRVRQITLDNEAEGQRVLGLLRQGLDFSEAARRYSISPDADQGGDLDFFGRGQMPDAFDAVVFELPVGRISDLVVSDYGYHLFLVEERRSAQRLALNQVYEEIEARLRTDKQEQACRIWLQGLRSQAVIEVDWTLL